jgi:hemerythrin-like metal-binding protein
MGLFNWTEKMSVGIEKIDKEHIQLFEMMNKIHDGMMTGKGQGALSAVITGLLDYTKFHFGDEEALLRQHDFPGLKDHIKLHESFKTKITDLNERLKKGSPALAVPALDFLQEWLVKHIQGVDFQYKAFLAAKGVK